MSRILKVIYGMAEASYKAGSMSEKKFLEIEKICKPRKKPTKKRK